MKILGISGLENAAPFKRREWQGLSERMYRICQGFDSAAALIVDGEIVAAAAEERFNRKKHCGDFPVEAARFCAAQAGVSLDEIDEIAHGFDYDSYADAFQISESSARCYREVYSRSAFVDLVRLYLPEAKVSPDRIFNVEHHLAHAASAYFTSGWNECLVSVMDGMGEVHSVTMWHARDGKLERIHDVGALDSIGVLYSLVTLHLGFSFNSDEYKIMGLAPYGDPERFRKFFDDAVQLGPNGAVRIPILSLNKTAAQRETYEATREHLSQHLIAARDPEAEITDVHRDVASSLQACLGRAVHHICSHYQQATGLRRLAMAGGVALNCTVNGQLLRSGMFDEIYVQPASGDDGTALGAALYRASQNSEAINRRMPVPYLGPEYGSGDVDKALQQFADRIEVEKLESRAAACERAAQLIAEGRVLAWYQGRMEFGPRALGNRSILADPGHPDMRDRVNALVKKREAFRPFAPAVSVEEVDRWFDVPSDAEFPYMIMIANVREEHRAALPAITHVNGTARIQTVSADSNKTFHDLLEAVGRATGRQMVLNTSFNVRGQPIVNTPVEAIETFLGTGLDVLFVDNNLITKKR